MQNEIIKDLNIIKNVAMEETTAGDYKLDDDALTKKLVDVLGEDIVE